MGLEPEFLDRARGAAVGAAIGDALGMPLEFKPAVSLSRLVREMTAGRLPAGSFTDDTEMALALAESLLDCNPLDGADLARRFCAWIAADPPDAGIQTRLALGWIGSGLGWEQAARRMERERPDSAGNGSVMRCWPAALAGWNDRPRMLADSALQSRVTHPHRDCVQGSQLVNWMICDLLGGASPQAAFESALQSVELQPEFADLLRKAPDRSRTELANSGWVRHTLESVVWGLLTTDSFAEAVIQVANLGNDADTAASVVGALAGAAYGLEGIPPAWRQALRGEWPLRSGTVWRVQDFVTLADRLVKIGA